jgi:hypothetical protein
VPRAGGAVDACATAEHVVDYLIEGGTSLAADTFSG